LVGVLKDEWGFDGFVVSDWGAIKETVAPALHGLDLEMPGPGRWWGGGRLKAAIESGEVAQSLLDDKVRRILGFLDWAGRLGTPTNHEEASIERPEHRELARRAAAESMVLLKNESAALPLAPDGTVALIGPGVAATAMLGGGSASLTPHRSTTVLDSMRARIGERIIGAEPGIDMRRKAASVEAEQVGDDGVTFELFDGFGFDREPFETMTRPTAFSVWIGDNFPTGHEAMSVRATFDFTPEVDGRHRVCALGFSHSVLFIDDEPVADNEVAGFAAGLGQHGGDGYFDFEAGRTYRFRLDNTPRDVGQWLCVVDVGVEPAGGSRDDGLVAAVELAARADTVVLVVGSSSEWESEGNDRDSLDLPNGQDELIERVRAVNENVVVVLNCGAPMNLPWLDDVSAALLAWYPGQEAGEAIADVLLGEAEPAGRMPTTWARHERDTPSYLNYPGEAGVVRYGEGVFVGYRGYDARGVEPLIPFGHGGSYTTFEWGVPVLVGSGTELVVEVPITNTGDREGAEVVQVYVAPREHVMARPQKELAGFAKLTVTPGSTATARVRLRDRSFARWDAADHGWAIDPGGYELLIAASAVDVRCRLDVEL